MVWFRVLPILIFFALVGCGEKNEAPILQTSLNAASHQTVSLPAPDEVWAHKWWLAKVTRTLRAGVGLSKKENLEALLAAPREQVVAGLLSDDRFADMALAFNLSFLGFQIDSVKQENGAYADAVYDFPQAISSARAVLENGDYFSLFNWEQPFYIGPLFRPQESDEKDKALKDLELRKKKTDFIQADLKAMLSDASKPNPPSPASLCERLQKNIFQYVQGNNLNLPNHLVFGIMTNDRNGWYSKAQIACSKPQITLNDFEPLVAKIVEENERLFAFFPQWDHSAYPTPNVRAIKRLDTAAIDPSFHFNQITFRVNQQLQNSSTNMNRRRAAYFLKRYFCDNLTPVNVGVPAQHSADAHGSEPACYSCHYKLDPMAGYFRNLGAYFFDFSGSDQIVFDDNAVASRAAYLDHWKASPGSPRTWNVGYIRSASSENGNSYGDQVQDLFGLLRTAPEVNRCLVQRLYEFLVSDTQAVDGDYIDYLADLFAKERRKSSVGAFKALVSRIVLSQSFSLPQINPEECYDHRPGFRELAGSPPCQVSSILNHSCVTCHHSTQDSPHLDLGHFQALSDGSFGFPHLAENGDVISSKATFQQIEQRLSSADPKTRMPYLSDMPSQDRQALFVWVSGEGSK